MKEKYVISPFIKQNFATHFVYYYWKYVCILYCTALCKQAKCGDQDVIVVAEEGALDDDDDAAAADEDMYMHIAT